MRHVNDQLSLSTYYGSGSVLKVENVVPFNPDSYAVRPILGSWGTEKSSDFSKLQ